MTYLTSSYDTATVIASVLIAAFASHVTLDLARRVRTRERHVARNWWLGGSLAMGSGIWATHFVGMEALSLPIAIGYSKSLTMLSWVLAVGVSALALFIASRGSLTLWRLAGGSLAMGAGICGMHYVGMAALDIAPGIVWNHALVAASAAIAVTASAVALAIFFWLRKLGDHRGLRHQVLAALVMGVAISGMHYTGMAAASFPAGSVCLSAGSLSGDNLGALVTLATITLLALTLGTSVFDNRLRGRVAQHAASLKQSNAKLKQAKPQ